MRLKSFKNILFVKGYRPILHTAAERIVFYILIMHFFFLRIICRMTKNVPGDKIIKYLRLAINMYAKYCKINKPEFLVDDDLIMRPSAIFFSRKKGFKAHFI